MLFSRGNLLPVALRVRFYKRLEFFSSKDVSLADAVKIINQYSRDRGLLGKFLASSKETKATKAFLGKLAQGQKFSQSIKGYFPDEIVSLITAGEFSNDVQGAFKMCIKVEDARQKIRTAVLSTFVGIGLQLLAPLVLLFGAGLYIIPSFADFIPDDAWTGAPLALKNFFDFILSEYMVFIGTITGFFIAFIVWSLPRWTGGLRSVADRFFPYSVYRQMVGSGFLASIGALLQSGMSEDVAVKNLMQINKGWYRYKLRNILRELNKGVNLAEAMWRVDSRFPDRDFCRDLRSLARYGGMEKQLVTMAVDSLEGSVGRLEQSAKIAKVFTRLLTGMVFVVVVSALVSMSLLLQDSIGGGAF